jgi:hypothetical protein
MKKRQAKKVMQRLAPLHHIPKAAAIMRKHEARKAAREARKEALKLAQELRDASKL